MKQAIVHSSSAEFTEVVRTFFRNFQIRCAVASDGEDLAHRLAGDPNLVAILWAVDGFDAVNRVRALRDRFVRSLVLVAMPPIGPTAPTHRAMALNAGADDAQNWPVDGMEFVERFRAACRRERESEERPIMLGDSLRFYPASGLLRGDQIEVQFPRREGELLSILAQRPGIVVPYEFVYESLYPDHAPSMEVVKVMLSKVRKRLEGPSGGMDFIEVVWGRGYRFVPKGFALQRDKNGKRVAG